MTLQSISTSLLILSALLIGCNRNPSGGDSTAKTVEIATEDFTDSVFTAGIEGPAIGPDGYLYLVNFGQEGTVGRVAADGSAELFVELPEGSRGNGIRFDRQGIMFIADYTGHNVLKVDLESREVSVFAHEPGMHQPNDLAIMDNDILFASDPDWKGSAGRLWRITPDGKMTLLEEGMGTTNGLEVSPDNRRLYVNESVQRMVWAYDLDSAGQISNKHLFHQFPDFGMDGMRCDVEGNLYITRYGKGSVAVLNPEGKLIQEVRLRGRRASNIAFGGPDGKTCYVTVQDRGRVETFQARYPGRSWKMRQR